MHFAKIGGPENLEDLTLGPAHQRMDHFMRDLQSSLFCGRGKAASHLAVIQHGGSRHIEANQLNRSHFRSYSFTTMFTRRFGITTTLTTFFPPIISTMRGSASALDSVSSFDVPAATIT